MNPIGALIILLAVVLIIIGIHGTQNNVKAALLGARPSVLAPGSGPSSSSTAVHFAGTAPRKAVVST